MKKISTLFTLIIAFSSVFAQGPTIEASYFPVAGTRFKHAYDTNSTQFNTPPASAPGTHWRYDTIFKNPTGMFPYQTYYADTARMKNAPNQTGHFRRATHASFLRGAIEDSIWQYLKADTVGVHYAGAFPIGQNFFYVGANSYQFFVDSVDYVNDELIMPAVANMQTNVMDDCIEVTRGKVPSLGLNNVVMKSYTTKTFKGYSYGSLTTPAGTWSNVLVLREMEIKIDTIFPGFPYPTTAFVADTVVRYHFLRNNTFGTSHLMLIKYNDAGRTFHYGFYVQPTDFGKIQGNVYDTTGLAVTKGKMLLYREHSLFAKDDILDSTWVNSSGAYTFDSIPYGVYRIACRADKSTYPNSLTTYYGDTTDWLLATEMITFTGDTTGKDTAGVDIHLRYGKPQGGSNKISGNIAWNLGKSGGPKATGEPLPGVDIIVRKKPGDKPVQGTITGPNGGYNFGNMDDGSYEMFVDIPGCHHAGTYAFTVSNGQVEGNLDFQVSLDSIYPTGSVTGIENQGISGLGNINIYPNPFNHTTKIQLELQNDAMVSIDIYDLTGKKIRTVNDDKLPYGSHFFTIGDNINANGVYLVRISIDYKTVETFKLIKK